MPYKDEGLCWIPENHSLKRKPGIVGHTGVPSTEKRKLKPHGLLASPAGSGSSRLRPISKIKRLKHQPRAMHGLDLGPYTEPMGSSIFMWCPY